MPIYRYDCDRCGHQFETLVRSSEVPACPSCDSVELTRQLSLVAAPAKNHGDAPMCGGAGACGTCPCKLD